MAPRLSPAIQERIRRHLPSQVVYEFMIRQLVEIVMAGVDPNMTFRARRLETKVYAVNDTESNEMQHFRDVIAGGDGIGYNFAMKNKIQLIEVGQCDALTKLHARAAFELWKSKYVGPCSDSKFDVFELCFSRGIRRYAAARCHTRGV